MSGEFERIARLRAIYGASHEGVAIGIGDDAAVTSSGQVLSVDAQVEGVHFRSEWIERGLVSWRDVGFRASIAALSDLAAMGAVPRAILQALVLPRSLDDAAVEAIAAGAAEAARSYGAPVIGGNLARGGEVSITTTVIGDMEGAAPLCRDGARPGDAVWVTGTLGAAALGLAVLEHALREGTPVGPEAAAFVRRFVAPSARVAEARALVGIARAAIDVSDGLEQDAGHVAAASGVELELDPSALPLAPGHEALARQLGLDPIELALSGGEDFELVVVAPEGAAIPGATRIGTVRPGSGVRVLGRAARPEHGQGGGFDHFAAVSSRSCNQRA